MQKREEYRTKQAHVKKQEGANYPPPHTQPSTHVLHRRLMLRLKYNGTDIEIKLGDRIEYKLIFFGSSEGVVYYMPGESPVHQEFEYDGVQNWAIKLNNGRVIAWIYLPEEVKATKRIKFIERGKGSFQGLQPDEELL